MRSYPKLLLVVLLAFPAAASAQNPPPVAPTLKVSMDGGRSVVLSRHDLDAMKQEKAEVVDEKGNHVAYEGVAVNDILEQVAAPSGHQLRGKQMPLYLLVSASDGYHAVFALAELDPDFTDKLVMLADRRDGKELSAAEGPFRLVVPDEKRHARWVRNVTALEVKRAE